MPSVFAPYANTPAHAVEEPLLDVRLAIAINRREVLRLRPAPAKVAGNATPRVTPLRMTWFLRAPSLRRLGVVPQLPSGNPPRCRTMGKRGSVLALRTSARQPSGYGSNP